MRGTAGKYPTSGIGVHSTMKQFLYCESGRALTESLSFYMLRYNSYTHRYPAFSINLFVETVDLSGRGSRCEL